MRAHDSHGDRLGNPPSHAVAYTWFVETLLVASEIVVLFKATRRQKPHTSVFVGVAFGAIINLASNVSSYWLSLIPEKIGGILMGATIPLGTAIAIWIFATTLTQRDNQAATTKRDTDDKRQTDQPDKHIIDKFTSMGIVGQTLVKTFAATRQQTDKRHYDRRSDADSRQRQLSKSTPQQDS